MEKLVLETVQWRNLNDIADVDPISDADYDVLKEIGDVLQRHGRTERFGVCLLHRHFDVREGEELIEETDVEERVSVVRVRAAGSSREPSIETMWRYTAGDMGAITKCEQKCRYSGGGHPRVHEKVGR